MDEPTTHLDVGSIDALIGALAQYEGTFIFISHDVHFIRAIASTVLQISAGQLTPYAGDYQYYLDKSHATSERSALTSGNGLTNMQPVVAVRVESDPGSNKPGLREQKEQKRADAEARKAEAKARREREQHLRELEMQIATLEGRQKELAAELEDPTVYESGGRAVAINRELSAVSGELERLTAEWEKASAATI
jgi:ATP-binding cassette subfamily F protein 3